MTGARGASTHSLTRLGIVTHERVEVARSSGTAVAVMRLRAGLAAAGVSTPLLDHTRGVRLHGYDALLGVDGAGFTAAGEVPFIALVKALYAGVLQHESRLSRLRLRRTAQIERAGARVADAVIVPSVFAADAVVHRYGVDAHRVHVVPEPFDVDQWRAALPRRERTGGRVLCVAHLYPRKRVADLLDAWPMVRAARSDARLDIVGAGPQLRALERQARDLPGCYMHGFAGGAALLEYFARADSFCLPSAQETFGYAVVEAMASGLPVVVANAGALPELTEGAVHVQVPWGAPRDLAAAVVRSLDASMRAAAATVNPDSARRFAPSLVIPTFLEVVEAALRQRRA